MKAHAIQLHRFSDAQALEWLRLRSPVNVTCMALAKQWGWHRNTVGKKLQGWAAKGHIVRGRKCITVPGKSAPIVHSAPAQPIVQTVVQSSASKLLAGLLFLIGLCISGVLLLVNIQSWATFAKGTMAAYAFVVLGVTVAVAVVVLPACARLADRGTATTLWCTWLFLFVVDVLITVGFAYGNFGSAVAGTAASVNQRAYQEQAIHRLRKEQQAMDGKFIPTSKEAAEAATQARQRACASATYCKAAELKEAAILRDRGMTVRAEDIAAELKEAESKLDGIPITASTDPLTDGVIDLVFGATELFTGTGHTLETRVVTTGRNVVFALFLLVPAGFFRSAASLARR